MKIKWNKKYTTIAVYSLIVIMLAVLFVVFVFKFDSVQERIFMDRKRLRTSYLRYRNSVYRESAHDVDRAHFFPQAR